MRLVLRLVSLLAGCCLAGGAAAHDSWLGTRGGVLTFTTGSRYPLAESAPAADSIVQAVCVDARGRRHRMAIGQTRLPGGPLACWAELREHEVVLTPELVEVYLKEIRPAEDVLRLRHPDAEWRESYRKFARIEIGAPAAAQRAPVGMPLEIVVEGDAPLRIGRPASFRVLAHGQPVPALSVELVSERSALGIWRKSDAEGRLRYVLPFGGDWVLRATLLERDGERWRSRFVTTAFRAE